jgi:hypothetical protein
MEFSLFFLRGRWCHIVLNVHAPTEDKTDGVKDSFYEELERVFDKFPKNHIKILLGDFNAKVGKEDIFKAKIGDQSLHEISSDNGVRLVNFATSKDIRVKRTIFNYLQTTSVVIHVTVLYLITSRPRPRVAVALPGDCLAVNVRLNDIVTFLDVTKLR